MAVTFSRDQWVNVNIWHIAYQAMATFAWRFFTNNSNAMKITVNSTSVIEHKICIFSHKISTGFCFVLFILGIFSEYTRSPFYKHGLTLVPVWINNYIHYKVWDEITYVSQTSVMQPLKFGNGYVISSDTLLTMRLLIHAGIKVNPCYFTAASFDGGSYDCSSSSQITLKHMGKIDNYWTTTKLNNRWVICPIYGMYCLSMQGSFVNAPTQWETMLHCTTISHWLGTFTKWSLLYVIISVAISMLLLPLIIIPYHLTLL